MTLSAETWLTNMPVEKFLTFENGIENVRYVCQNDRCLCITKRNISDSGIFSTQVVLMTRLPKLKLIFQQQEKFNIWLLLGWLLTDSYFIKLPINYKILILTLKQYLNTSLKKHMYTCTPVHCYKLDISGPTWDAQRVNSDRIWFLVHLVPHILWARTVKALVGRGQNLKAKSKNFGNLISYD